MPNERPVEGEFLQVIASRFEAEADSARTAAIITSTFETVHATLVPVIGTSGVTVIFFRSREIASRVHPWLAVPEHDDSPPGFGALRTILAKQNPRTAAAGGNAIITSFHELLSGMVGASLTERLLRPVLTSLPSKMTDQEYRHE
jgi:hypothetical protein